MASTRTHTALVDDLVASIDRRLVDPLEIVLGTSGPVDDLRARVRIDAQLWAAQLLGPDQTQAVATATRLVAALFPGDGAFTPRQDWWASPFGRVVARRVGHPGSTRVSPVEAAAMLGITRQGVHDLLRRGKLTRDPDGRVDTAGVRARLEAHP